MTNIDRYGAWILRNLDKGDLTQQAYDNWQAAEARSEALQYEVALWVQYARTRGTGHARLQAKYDALEAENDAWAEKWMAERAENKALRGLVHEAFELLAGRPMTAGTAVAQWQLRVAALQGKKDE